jgi:hypothetical protein
MGYASDLKLEENITVKTKQQITASFKHYVPLLDP